MRRSAFTFLEVLVSVIVLFGMGMALLRFDAQAFWGISKYGAQNEALLIFSPALWQTNNKSLREYELYDITSFAKLRDDESTWLKGQTIHSERGEFRTKTLFEGSGTPIKFRAYDVTAGYKETDIPFKRIIP